MRRGRPALAAVLAPLLLAGGCSGGEAPSGGQGATAVQAARPAPRVLETFQVGGEVYVRALAVEAGRNALWVGTSLGVLEIDLQSRELRGTFTRREGLANEYVFAIAVDSRGYKWFGTNGGGISRYRDGEWRTYFPMHGLADYWVYAFAEQPDGALWIGTWAGANRLDVTQEKFVTYFDELVNEWVYGVAVDGRGRVWFGTEGGVSMRDGERWQAWTHRDGLGAPNRDHLPSSTNTGLGTRARHDLSVLSDGRPTYNPNYVFCIHAAADGAIWAGTWGGGVARYDGERWRNFTTADGLAGNIVFSIAEDGRGDLWFGTDRGLSRYDGRAWAAVGRGAGLAGDSVFALAAAPDGTMWAGTKGGVARIGD